jgi:signal transduction histidine kinase
MTIRVRLTLWFVGMLLVALVLLMGWAYYEMFIEHRTPDTVVLLQATGEKALAELGEIFLYGGVPALLITLVGGWFLMRRVLAPVISLTQTAERMDLGNLKERLPRTGNGDELDRLTEVFNSMMTRLDDSVSRVREFSLHASHELKTPLTVMHAGIESALREDQITPAQRDLLAGQLDEIQRLAKIVDGLTLLARADSGQVAMHCESVRLDELVRDSFTDAQMLAGPGHVKVELAACEEVVVQGDRHRLRQLLLNLTDNAIKYNRPQGSVTITLNRKNGTAVLNIANTGAGIAPEKIPRVFDRFFRGDPSHSSAVDGCGLGLSIAQWIVHAHGGSIAIVSEPDALTRVTVRLPL